MLYLICFSDMKTPLLDFKLDLVNSKPHLERFIVENNEAICSEDKTVPLLCSETKSPFDVVDILYDMKIPPKYLVSISCAVWSGSGMYNAYTRTYTNGVPRTMIARNGEWVEEDDGEDEQKDTVQ